MILKGVRRVARSALRNRYSINLSAERLKQYQEQFAYGHREILLDYADLSRELIFKALIPHGKITSHALDPIRPHFDLIDGTEMLQLLWRDDACKEAFEVGVKRVSSIGAPFLYTLANLGQPIQKTKENIRDLSVKFNWKTNNQEDFLKSQNKIAYLPMHSWEGDVHLHHVSKDSVLRRVDPKRVIVCLGFLDFCDPSVRRVYEDCGWNLTCAGIRDSMIPSSPAGGREKFLYELANIFSDVDVVVSNEFTTGLFYACALGKDVGVIHESKDYEFEYSSWGSAKHFREILALQEMTYPWLWGNKSAPENIELDIRTALGIKSFKEPVFFHNEVEKIRFMGYGVNTL